MTTHIRQSSVVSFEKRTTNKRELKINQVLLTHPTNVCCRENYIVPILKVNKNNIKMEKMEGTVVDLLKQKKAFNKVKCFHDIQKAIQYLRKQKIMHNDVHFLNICYKQNYKQNSYFLIDFGLGSFVSKQSPSYEQLLFTYREDEFSLLWNLIFGCNKMISDFSLLKLALQGRPKIHSRLQLKMKKFFPQKKINYYFKYILDPKKFPIKKQEAMECKLFLNRLYLIFYIFYVDSKNETINSKLFQSF